jgi:hypothetical protein
MRGTEGLERERVQEQEQEDMAGTPSSPMRTIPVSRIISLSHHNHALTDLYSEHIPFSWSLTVHELGRDTTGFDNHYFSSLSGIRTAGKSSILSLGLYLLSKHANRSA